MSPSPAPSAALVGNADARAIHGHSRGADCILLAGTAAPVGPAPESTPAPAPGIGTGAAPAAGSDDLAADLQQICGPTTVPTIMGLADLAESAAAAGGTGPLVLADAELRLQLPGMLDLLDGPGDPTATLLADPRNIEAPRQPEHGLDQVAPVRVDADGRLVAEDAARHRGSPPDRVLVGLLRIRAADRPRAATLWRAAARELTARPGSYAGRRLFDVAVLALVGGGLPIGGRALGYYTWSRGPAGQTGLGRSAWQQRLRSASRLGDGAYSAAVVRPLSRIGTRLGLRVGLTPNVVTMISLAVGVLAGLLILTGDHPLWIVAAVLLQLALVIDCMDGEIARFTRRFSAFGGWLDGIGDRVKEYLVFAAVGAVAVRTGHPSGWLLAMIAMVIVTARHLEDYAYGDRSAAQRTVAANAPEPEAPLPPDGAPSGFLPPPATRRQRIVFWAKKVAHVPIAERYLILSLGLLTGRPVWVLVAAIAVSSFALAWAVGGRLLRAVRAPHPPANPTLDQQLDLGRPARAVGRAPIRFLPGVAVLIVCWLLAIAGICGRWWPLALIAAALAVVVAGSALREPSCHRFGWLALPLVWAAESAVIGSLLSWSVPGVLLFCVLAAVAYRRYELIYSIRLRGPSGPAALLGFDGRILLVAVLVAIAALIGTPGPTAGVLGWGLVAIGLETLVEAIIGTVRRWRRTTPDTEV